MPCRIASIRRSDDPDRFVFLLREHNRQRDKSLAVKLREEIINADPTEAHRALTEYREKSSVVETEAFDIVGRQYRAKISKAKQPMLDAICEVIDKRRRFWPLSDRMIHYLLLSKPPLIHASKPGSRYDNSSRSYKALVDLLTRARIAGDISWNAIQDTTRPVTTWDVYSNPRLFIRSQLESLFKGYYRDLMQSQFHHIEIVVEKNSVEPILRSVAAQYTIPLTSGRGFCSSPPRHSMAERYIKSGKDKLIVLIVSDFDPCGESIAHSFARSMRDDFGVTKVHPIRVALTAEQIEQYDLPPFLKAKKGSSGYKKFVEKYGDDTVFELEALEPTDLQAILREAIDSVIDIDLFNKEVEAEVNDAVFLEGIRNTVHKALAEMNWDLAV